MCNMYGYMYIVSVFVHRLNWSSMEWTTPAAYGPLGPCLRRCFWAHLSTIQL